MIAVGHPDLFAPLGKPAVEKRQPLVLGRDIGAAEFGGAVAAFDSTAKAMHHHLLAIADAKDRHAKAEDPRRRHRRAVRKDRGRTAGEDHRPRRELLEESVIHPVEGMDFAIDVQFAQPPRDKLRDLAAEVDDEKALMRMCHGAGLGFWPALRKRLWCRAGALPPHPRGISGIMYQPHQA